MFTKRLGFPVWVLASLGLLVLGTFVGLRIFGPDYVVAPFSEDPESRESLEETLRSRGVPFIVTESELWAPRRELDRLREDPSPPM